MKMRFSFGLPPTSAFPPPQSPRLTAARLVTTAPKTKQGQWGKLDSRNKSCDSLSDRNGIGYEHGTTCLSTVSLSDRNSGPSGGL